MNGKTISEKILSRKSGKDVRAGDLVVCEVDRVIGTDASAPMAIDYFEKMGGNALAHPERVLFVLDHYVPPSTVQTARLHDRVREFGKRQGARVLDVGEGISHQLVCELGLALPGCLVAGADSHTVTSGALNAFATGVGSSDLAAAMLTGRLWFRVPESIKIVLVGVLPSWLSSKDIALELAGKLGSDGSCYQTLEYHGPGAAELELEDRLVLSNMSVETGAKAGIFCSDGKTLAYLKDRTKGSFTPVNPDEDARYAREVALDLSHLRARIALPHQPDNVVSIDQAAGTPIHMVFLGTCTGGRVRDFHQAVRVLETGGGIAPGVRVVVTPASKEVYLALARDGTLLKLIEMGAVVTPSGCGPCCGTAGPVPGDGMNVISTANRNFKARMGNTHASIFLASPAVCAAAAVMGKIADPLLVEG